MNNDLNYKLTGVFVVEKKWNLIWLKNKVKNINESFNYFKFESLLHQIFDEEKVKKILDALNTENKLLIDFDKAFVKLIKEPEPDFKQYYGAYFTSQAAQDWLDSVEDFEDNMYKGANL